MTRAVRVLLGAYLWQLLPPDDAASCERWQFRMIGMIAALPLGARAGDRWSVRCSNERLFAGDIKAWLDGQVGSGTGGWMFLLLPLCAVAGRAGDACDYGRRPSCGGAAGRWRRSRFAVLDLAQVPGRLRGDRGVWRYLAVSAPHAVGWDPRGTFVDTYVQRNALVVGFVMGFAIIPIIYTIADDALSAVPESPAGRRRSAPAPRRGRRRSGWSMPTAMSGLFSAIMIGLGRAVGETMIVLMAAGNTPVMDWNIFNGFRTLSANIAVELPEAVLNSTHYRMLFLAALTLFVMTFVVNTVAEIVRLRFRRRAFQL